MINRELDKVIENHYNTNKSALLLTGARQTGKTFAIRKYAKEHGLDLIEINFLQDPSAKSIFDGVKDAREILLRISAYTHSNTKPENTLIFFDEVQLVSDIITWIKFLVDEGSFRYALSGSLLGVELKDIRSVPVGYMTVYDVYPLDFQEFAEALGVGRAVIESLRTAWKDKTAVDTVVHNAMMRIVALYLVVGGMPAAVQTYIDTNNLRAVQEKQKEIIRLYHWDIAQYDPDNKLYIDDIFSLIPSELNAKNKRFILKNLNEHRQFSRHENGFIWLRDAGVALPAYNVEQPVPPLLLSRQRNLFKLFQSDVGLLAAQYAENVPLRILNGDVSINFGAIYENFVAQEIKAHGFDLYYFNSKRQGEIDFILENDAQVTPVEVKSGKDYERHRALNNLLKSDEYEINSAYVLCNDNLAVNGNIVYAPIYMTMFMRKNTGISPMLYKIDISDLK